MENKKMGIFVDEDGNINPEKLVWTLFIIFIGLYLIFSTIVIVGAGHRGVVLKFGEVQDEIFGEGLHFKVPIMERVIKMEVRTQKYEAEASAASKDLQDTKTTVALNYHLNPNAVNKLYQELGLDYADRYISPSIQEVVKATTAQFNAEELITKRPEVKAEIDKRLKERLNERGITVETLSLTNFQFSEEFSKSIEDKVTAQQLALKAENDLIRIKVEAQQIFAKAEGEARAIEVIEQQLGKSPNYIHYLAVQNWDGVMPLVTGTGSMPLISVPVGNATQ